MQRSGTIGNVTRLNEGVGGYRHRMAGLQIASSIIGTLALLFGAGMAAWRLSMLLGWKRRSATVTGYQHQRVRRGSAYSRVTVRLTRRATARWSKPRTPASGTDTSRNRRSPCFSFPNSDPVRVVVPEFLRFCMMSLIFVPFGAVFLYVALVYVPSLG